MFWKSILKSLIKLETFCNRSVLIRGLEVEEIIPFPDWINPFPVLKINFELLEKNEGHFVKDIFIRDMEYSRSFLVNLTLSPSIFVYLGLSLTIFDFLGLSRSFSVYLGPFRSISVYLGLFWTILGYLKLLRAIMSYFNYFRLSLAISDHLWLSRPISGFLYQASSIRVQAEAGGSKILLFKNVLFFSIFCWHKL